MPDHFSHPGSGHPPASPAARDHLRQLRGHGGTFRSIARAAGLGTATIHDLLTRRRRPTQATVAAVLAVPPSRISRPRVDAGGTRLRLRALHVMGHGSARIATATGVSERAIRLIIDGTATTVTAWFRAEVIAVYDQWWDKRAPERAPGERAAATLARRRAIRGNWCAGGALDDELLDIPGYQPGYGWRPAAGTGTAIDITAPRRPLR